MSLGAPELIIILLMVLVLFGYKKLPDASRAFGRSLRIFKGEMKGMKEDDPVSRHSTMNDQIAASSSAGQGQASA